jgi:hypothetical protein
MSDEYIVRRRQVPEPAAVEVQATAKNNWQWRHQSLFQYSSMGGGNSSLLVASREGEKAFLLSLPTSSENLAGELHMLLFF